MFLKRLTTGFVAALVFLACNPIKAQGVGGLGGGTTGGLGATGGLGGFGGTTGATSGTGATGGTGGTGAAGGTTGGQVGGLLNQTTSFQGFTQNFGSGNAPFAVGTSSLNGNNNGIGTLSGGATGTAGGATAQSRTGQTGLGGIGGGLGGIGGGLGGIGGGRGGFGQGGFGQGGFGGGGFGQNQFGNTGRGSNQTQTRNSIKTVYKPAFEPTANTPPPVTDVQRSTLIQARMLRLPLPDKYRTVQVAVLGRTAVLTGEVNSEADARFVAKLVSLESGIDSVESRLTIKTASQESAPAVPNR